MISYAPFGQSMKKLQGLNDRVLIKWCAEISK
jgi:hypothetical protein